MSFAGGITDPHTVPTDGEKTKNVSCLLQLDALLQHDVGLLLGPLHTSPSTQVSTMKSSGRPFSSSSGHTPASVVPPGKLDEICLLHLCD